MKSIAVAFAAVILAAIAPQTGPFKRFIAPEPTIPHEDPVTDEQLRLEPPILHIPAPSDGQTAKRRVSDRSQNRFFKRFRSTNSTHARRRRTTTSEDERSGRCHAWGDRRPRRANNG